MISRLVSVIAIAAALCLTLAPPSLATSFVMVSDADLARQAEAIAVVRVLGAGAGPAAAVPSTDYRVEVERVLKGEMPDALATVRVPGGAGVDGMGLRIWGAPRFADGSRALLFLRAGTDGAYRILHLMLGAFHEVEVGGLRLALRDLAEATQVQMRSDGSLGVVDEPLDLPRDFDRFADWLEAQGAGAEAGGSAAPRGAAGVGAPDYFTAVEPGALASAFPRYTILSHSDGHPIRWFDFDSGGTIHWEADSGGQPGLSGGGFNQVRAAIQAWNDDPGSTIRYNYNGTTTNTITGCAGPSQVGKVVFDDPHNDILGSYGCSSGGILAQGGPCFQLSLLTYKGTSYHPAVDAFVVTNDGLECFFQKSATPIRAAEELFAHELGHTLGLGHTGIVNALMYSFIHNDGRGAQLHSDDRAGVAELYGDGGSPPPPPPPPAAPSDLVATALSASEVRLTWRDNASDETGFRIEQRRLGGVFSQIATVGANTSTYTSRGLAAETTYELRVRAVNGGGFSPYSNTASATTHAAALSPPVAPGDLVAMAISPTEVRLSWRDNSSDEDGFRIEARSDGAFEQVATSPADTTILTLGNLSPQTAYELRVRAVNPAGSSPYSNVAAVTTPGEARVCQPAPTTLCLFDGALRVEVDWRNQHAGGRTGQGTAIADDGGESGSFWFFSSDSIELVVKAVDGRGINGHYWFFYGALSDVEYWIRITETASGATTIYHNAPGEICGRGDTEAVLASAATAPLQAAPAVEVLPLAAAPLPPRPAAGSAVTRAAGTCQGGPRTLCLLDDRFAVEVDWVNQHRAGMSGIGRPVPWSAETGYFWFFDPDSLELVVKAIDGRGANGRFWFFYGALSDVEYRITVTDTVTGQQRIYENPPGEICGRGDTVAF